MTCAKTREQIDDWLDQKSNAGMPVDAAEHVKACSECRLFVTQWHAVEARLLAVREEAPNLSAGFRSELRNRLDTSKARPSWFAGFQVPRFAMAGTMAFILLAILVAAQMVKQRNSMMANNSTSLTQPATLSPTLSPR